MAMAAFVLLTGAFLIFMGGICAALAHFVNTDTLESDLDLLWDRYPADVQAKIRKTFE
ncbi:hypothetical protein ACFFK0_23580 [Paenibacillus chartarius]|uniref:Nematode cuticle collagen N-terminal domain-containing protein n=1 Tax=Paenibacillus chartarius TaxID=747481 RepID=A0ABV6DRU7_9BACL